LRCVQFGLGQLEDPNLSFPEEYMLPQEIGLPVPSSVQFKIVHCLLSGLVLCLLGVTPLLTAQTTAKRKSHGYAQPGSAAAFFVATDGNDNWSGTLPSPNSKGTDGPFASVAQAQLAVRSALKTNPSSITVQIRNGTYYLAQSPTAPGTLNFTASDSGTSSIPITWENYPKEMPILSGGVTVSSLGLTWMNVSGNLWQVQLPSTVQPFESLFYNGQRRMRSRLESASGVGYYMKNKACIATQTGQSVAISFCNLATFLRVSATIPPTGANSKCPSFSNGTDSKCMDRFVYNPSDPIAQFVNLNGSYTGNPASPCTNKTNSYPPGDVELTLFDAWTADLMRINCIDTSGDVIYLTGSTETPTSAAQYSYFGPAVGHRYVIDNTKNAFTSAKNSGQTGLWFLDRSHSKPVLNYLANAGENPNTDSVVVPQLGGAIPGAPAIDYIGASLLFAQNLSNVSFSGITFEVDNFYPSATGANNGQSEQFSVPQTVDCESCTNVTFDNVIVRHTSGSGLLLASLSGRAGPTSQNDLIEDSAFYDIGAAGIRIGHHPSGGDVPQFVPSLITAQNNIVQGYSRVFPDGEGIAMGNGHDVTFEHNDIDDGYHSGVKVCTDGCYSKNFSANGINIVTQFNHIWNVMQGITSDSGALYYNTGSQTGFGSGNQILNNLVYDVNDASIIDQQFSGTGYGGHGIYLDIQSAGILIQNNVVYDVSSTDLYMAQGPISGQPANTIENNILAYARSGTFANGTPWPTNCSSTQKASVSSNILYFDQSSKTQFYPLVGCADSCGMSYNEFQKYEGNLYWRTDGSFGSDPQAFHVLPNPPPPGQANTCGQPYAPSKDWTFFGFSEWQNSVQTVNGAKIQVTEDASGTVTTNPGFGDSGLPTDFLLTKNPVAGFNYTETNETINSAGRSNPVIIPPTVPATFPTFYYPTSAF